MAFIGGQNILYPQRHLENVKNENSSRGYSLTGAVFAQHTQSSGFDPKHCVAQAWWNMSVIPALRRWRQGNEKAKFISGYKLEAS